MAEEDLRNTVLQPLSVSQIADLSGIPICPICERLLEENQRKTDLLCDHVCHTLCFFTLLHEDHDPVCPSCNGLIFPRRFLYQAGYTANPELDQIQQAREAKKEAKRIEFETNVMENEELLKDLKIVKRSITEFRKASAAFRKIANASSKEFSEETNQILEIIKSCKQKRIEALKKCPEAKLYRSKQAKAKFYMSSLERKYPQYTIHKLSKIRQLRLPGRSEIYHLFWGTYRRALRNFYVHF